MIWTKIAMRLPRYEGINGDPYPHATSSFMLYVLIVLSETLVYLTGGATPGATHYITLVFPHWGDEIVLTNLPAKG